VFVLSLDGAQQCGGSVGSSGVAGQQLAALSGWCWGAMCCAHSFCSCLGSALGDCYRSDRDSQLRMFRVCCCDVHSSEGAAKSDQEWLHMSDVDIILVLLGPGAAAHE
jgi:hypothetical protein